MVAVIHAVASCPSYYRDDDCCPGAAPNDFALKKNSEKQEFESTEVHSKYQDTCNGLSETSDSYEDLTDESNACEDDLTLPTVALNAFSLSFPSAEGLLESNVQLFFPSLPNR